MRNDYKLIELGDGDELWKNKNLVDIAYNYRDIFKILNEFNKKKIYIWYLEIMIWQKLIKILF
ncbi:hypothetical protein CNEO_43855 [Clostridium neonatale]|uniref:Uncharacterized protein n=1 Tax=Clostridium neonatale TaxID=137838 RepID=A0AA86JKR8_9CLOT|nr:hypothetical protein CNEO_43855 [Clostridium neonatale]